MSPALQIDDVVHLIVSFIQAKHDLASLLRTCKIFEDHARKKLWQKLIHTSTLVRLMPSDVISDNGTALKLADDCTYNVHCPSDWVGSRFKLYARCVKDFGPYTTGDDFTRTKQYPCVSFDIIDAWNIYHKTFGPSLPALRALHYTQVREPLDADVTKSFRLMGCLFQPAINSLLLDFIQSSNYAISNYIQLFKAMKDLGNTLTTLTLVERTERPLIPGLLQDIIPNLRSLTHFYGGICIDSIDSLAVLPRLETLSVRISSNFRPLSPENERSSTLFPVLEVLQLEQQQLDLDTVSVESLLSIVRCVSSTRLSRLHLRWGRFVPPRHQLLQIRETLSTPPVSDGLREVDIGFGYNCQNDAVASNSSDVFEIIAASVGSLPNLIKLTLPNNSFSFTTPEAATSILSVLDHPALQGIRLPMTLPAYNAVALGQTRCLSVWINHTALLLDPHCSDLGSVSPITSIEELGVMNQLESEAMNPGVAAPRLRLQFPQLRKIICMDVTANERFKLRAGLTDPCTCRTVAELLNVAFERVLF